MIIGGGTVAIGGSGAFTRASAPREFSVTTATDENALLGVRTVDVTFTQIGQTRPILELNNQTGSTIKLDNKNGITKDTIHNFLVSIQYPSEIEPDDGWIEVTAGIRKKRKNQNPVEVTVNAQSDSTSISVIQALEIATDLSIEGCPVTPSTDISVGNDAMGDEISSHDLEINQDVDGIVKTEPSSNAKITIKEGATVAGDVIADGEITIENNCKIDGNIMIWNGSKGSNQVTIGESAVVAGNVIADGKIDIGKRSKISGYIQIREETKGSSQITIGEDTIIGGSLTANGKIQIEKRSKIGGSMSIWEGSNGSHQITVADNGTICGSITANGTVDIKKNSRIDGDVTTRAGSNAKIVVEENGIINGGVFPDKGYDIKNNVTINGNDPRPSAGN